MAQILQNTDEFLQTSMGPPLIGNISDDFFVLYSVMLKAVMVVRVLTNDASVTHGQVCSDGCGWLMYCFIMHFHEQQPAKNCSQCITNDII